MLPTLSKVLAVAGCGRDDFNNWKRRKLLRANVPQTTTGVARQMTRDAALEIAFIAALTDVGFDAASAADRAEEWLHRHQDSTLEAIFIYNPRTGATQPLAEGQLRYSLSTILAFDELTDPEEGRSLPEGEFVGEGGGDRSPPNPATSLRFVFVSEIIRRIDALFESHTDEV